MLTTISPFVHSPDEYGIVHSLTPEARLVASQIQGELVGIFGDAIWLQPPPSLHITLMEIINDTSYAGLTRQQYFDKWYSTYAQTVRKIIASFPSFEITFTELVVSERAIILKAASSENLNELRARILAETELPSGTKLPPDISHTTLARFAKAIDLDEARDLSRNISVNLTELVDEFALGRDLGPPDFNGQPLETYKLTASS